MPDYTTLKGFNDIGDSSISEIIQSNLINYLDWGFIDKGAFFNVNIPTSGEYGGDKNRLRLADDPNYSGGQVWEGFRSNWVWESGLSTSSQPIQVSGVYVNGTFHPLSETGAYSHTVNYPLGRIVFNSPISENSNVRTEFSYRWIKIYDANDIPWFKEIQFDSFRLDRPQFLTTYSGDWYELGGNRIQLPAIAVEVCTNGHAKGYALGGGHWVYRTCLFHVFTEDKASAMRIADILANQVDKTIYLYDIDRIVEDNKYPLDINGSIASGALTYPQLIDQYMLYKLTFLDNQIQKLYPLGPNLYHVPVRFEAETILGNI